MKSKKNNHTAIRCVDIPGFEITYIPVPKNCSTTILYYLYFLMHNKVFETDKIKPNGQPLSIHDFFYINYTNDFDVSSQHKSFLIVRDPIWRFISSFKSRVKIHKEFENSNITINDFISDLEDNIKSNDSLQHHMMPQSSWVGSDLSIFDLVYSIECMGDLNQKLKEITSTDHEFKRLHASGLSNEKSELTKKSLHALIDYYSDDYQLLEDFYSPE